LLDTHKDETLTLNPLKHKKFCLSQRSICFIYFFSISRNILYISVKFEGSIYFFVTFEGVFAYIYGKKSSFFSFKKEKLEIKYNYPCDTTWQVRLRVCLVWRRWKLILIELSLRELILIKSELNVNWFVFGYTFLKVILLSWCCLDCLNQNWFWM